MHFLYIFMRQSALSALIMSNFHVYNWENANIKDLNAWRILMKFLCIYLGEGRGGGHYCMYIHGNTQSLPLLQNCLMDVYETLWISYGRHICLGFLSDPPWGGSKVGQEGGKESFKDKRLYLECCHSGSGFSQIFQGMDSGRGKNRKSRGFSFDEILIQTKCSQQHTDILPTTHASIWILSFWLSVCWLNFLLMVLRLAIKGPWASSLHSLKLTFVKKTKITERLLYGLENSIQNFKAI